MPSGTYLLFALQSHIAMHTQDTRANPEVCDSGYNGAVVEMHAAQPNPWEQLTVQDGST